MNEEIEKAIKLLRSNGYVVVKYTKAMDVEAEKCELGEDKLCQDCSCFICMAGISD